MMLLRRLLYFIVLFLSVACVCVAAGEEKGPSSGGSNCEASTGSECKNDPKLSESARVPAAPVGPLGERGEAGSTALQGRGTLPAVRDNDLNTELRGTEASDNERQDSEPAVENHSELTNTNSQHRGAETQNQLQQNSDAAHTQSPPKTHNEATTVPHIQTPTLQETPSADPEVSQQEEHSAKSNSANSDNTANQNDPATESPSSTASAQPPATSSTQETDGTKPTEAADVGNDSTPAGREPTSAQDGAADNTETTTTSTTTTTLLPEPTNNKKGDADSSSSISSSVWVRVPLLIVVTLACILVC
ncbi:uncharacterized protein TM35_001051010 [Trypanosoma theileri]|uniref:Mucin TcMUCII n=1 Tax=Trypanosoma theileri TaxID=67003 RepID=A0A1X0NE15_9TRYP|nr:uncharacterized protein TM35_001051010 [Trypanosoma theileri]ORC81844.1 hypothetical protein TM35_001051010 [Trypanosoma theileri]